jgi:hypothetical protein
LRPLAGRTQIQPLSSSRVMTARTSQMVIGSSAVSRLVEAARWRPALAGLGSHEDEGGRAGIPLADVDLLTDE